MYPKFAKVRVSSTRALVIYEQQNNTLPQPPRASESILPYALYRSAFSSHYEIVCPSIRAIFSQLFRTNVPQGVMHVMPHEPLLNHVRLHLHWV